MPRVWRTRQLSVAGSERPRRAALAAGVDGKDVQAAVVRDRKVSHARAGAVTLVRAGAHGAETAVAGGEVPPPHGELVLMLVRATKRKDGIANDVQGAMDARDRWRRAGRGFGARLGGRLRRATPPRRHTPAQLTVMVAVLDARFARPLAHAVLQGGREQAARAARRAAVHDAGQAPPRQHGLHIV